MFFYSHISTGFVKVSLKSEKLRSVFLEIEIVSEYFPVSEITTQVDVSNSTSYLYLQ